MRFSCYHPHEFLKFRWSVAIECQMFPRLGAAGLVSDAHTHTCTLTQTAVFFRVISLPQPHLRVRCCEAQQSVTLHHFSILIRVIYTGNFISERRGIS